MVIQAARKRPAADSAAALTALTPLKRQVLEASSIEKPRSKRRKNRQQKQKTLAPFKAQFNVVELLPDLPQDKPAQQQSDSVSYQNRADDRRSFK
uniref:Ribosome biogenesis protein SLX9 n=1 Tax=Macrostomum lignano TaxID=282301 RepID=A0A1I8F7K8_9PLAT